MEYKQTHAKAKILIVFIVSRCFVDTRKEQCFHFEFSVREGGGKGEVEAMFDP